MAADAKVYHNNPLQAVQKSCAAAWEAENTDVVVDDARAEPFL